MSAANPFVCIEFVGDGALRALHGQCTQDLLQIATNTARLGAFCNPKGRMLGSGRFVRTPDRLLMVTAADQSDALLLHLQPVLRLARAHAELTPGPVALIQATDPDLKPGEVRQHGTRIEVGEFGNTRWILDDPDTAHDPLADVARLQAGLAMVHSPVAGQLIPQQAHYQMLDGVSFTKGCYTGQEIIARLEHLGESKKVLKIYTGSEPLQVGSTLNLDQEQLLVCDAAGNAETQVALVLAPVGFTSEQLADVPFTIIRQVAGERPIKR